MNKKKRIFRILETYINELKNSEVEEFYGKNSKIKIHQISESLKDKCVLIEAVVILGDEINEDVLDTSMAEVLIRNSFKFFDYEKVVKTIVRWDV